MDQLDAVLLAEMGSVLDLALYQAPIEKIIFLKQLQTARDALIRDRTAAKNRQKILEQSVTRWNHQVAASCGKNNNLESFAT